MKTKLYQWCSFTLLIAFAFMMQNCQENEIIETDDLQTSQQEDVALSKNDKIKKNKKIDVLVYDAETDTWKTISVSVNSLQTQIDNGGVPSYGGVPIAYNPITEKIWMDRNLGASQVATSSTDAASYGDLYQWGRGPDGHQIRTNQGTTTTLSPTDEPGHSDFILTSPTSPWDWRSPQNDNLWQGVNGVNNPCPVGFRIPTLAEWDAERASWSSDDATGAFASPLKLTVAGYRTFTNGLLSLVGHSGFYWNSTGTLHFRSGEAGSGESSKFRAYGFSCRCIQD